MKRIGFIGLGTMGLPMAANLLKKGYPLTVYNRTKSKALPLIELGAELVDSPRDVAVSCDVLFTILTNDAAVEEVMFGEQGVLQGVHDGLIVLDSSTVSPNISKKMAQVFQTSGVDILDAPVTGSEPQAIAGILTFMVGGKYEIYEACLPLFKAMGQNAYYMGDHGAGSYTKLANNVMAAINLLAFTESMVMAVKTGIDPDVFAQVVNGGGARSGMADSKSKKVMARDFQPNFSTALLNKDLGLALDLASELQLPVPVLSTVREMLKMSISHGYANEDICSVIKCYEQWAGVEVQKL